MSAIREALLPPLPSTIRGASVKLGVDPKGERVIYCNNRSVFLVSLDGQQPNIAYAGHSRETTVAKVSPSGFYAASADVSGTVRVWSLDNEELPLKSEVKALGGRINALDWDSESKRILVGGDGRERFAHAFMFDSGSSVGELSGHSKVVNAAALRRQRPFRAVTGGDDRSLIFSHGVPYKYAKTLTEHNGFIQDVAFSPSGDFFASVGTDGKLLIYNGSTGDFVSSLSSLDHDGHKGGIFAVSWSKDSKFVSTSGADRTTKVWDIQAQSVVQSWSFGDSVDFQQVGNVWSPNASESIVSASFNGELNVLDKRVASSPSKVIYGHQKSITALSNVLPSAPTFYTGSYDGKVNSYTFSKPEGECKPVGGVGHTNAVVAIVASDRGTVFSAGMDDTVREIDSQSSVFNSTSLGVGSQPSSLAVDGQGSQYVTTVSEILRIQDGKKTSAVSVKYNPSSIAVSPSLLAVGGPEGKVYLYDSVSLQPHNTPVLEKNRAAISALSFSPDGQFLAAGDSNGKIMVYDATTGEIKTASWVFHTAKITSISWSPSSTHAVSGSLDTNVYIWSLAKPMKKIAVKNAHAGGVAAVSFLSEDIAVSAGADAAVRTWKITHHPV